MNWALWMAAVSFVLGIGGAAVFGVIGFLMKM